MCGIAATIDLRGRGRAAPWAVELLRHRGPDGEGVWQSPDDNVSLEHTRLAIIDPFNREADQPFLDPSGRWAMVYNGEIFNFRDLRAELERSGERFRTQSDTEVLLAGFLRWGEDVLPRLRGMFAFVVCDRQTGEVFAARDQIGVKPLYYLEHDGRVALCSEVKPLLALPGHSPRLHAAGVVEFLAFGKNPSELTIIEGLRKLLPGHLLRIRDGELTIRQYWDLVGAADAGAERPPTEAEVMDQLEQAVGASLVSDVPLGLMLSAGLDSSLVAALAARQVDPGSLTAYSVAFGVPGDEAAEAGRLAGDLGINFREVRVGEQEVRDVFEGWLDRLDYPNGNPTWIASWFIAQAAHADDVKVLLTGDGGDELFGGYTRWMKYLRFHDRVWQRIPGPALRAAGSLARNRVGGLAGDIARRAADGGDLFVTSRPFHDDDLRSHLGPAGAQAAAQLPPETIFEDLRRHFDERGGGDYLAWMSYSAAKTSLVEDFLQRLDKMGMQHSVEGRVPLLDPVMARWIMQVPQAAKVVDGEQKSLLRMAARRVLPEYVLARRKQGFCAPVTDWSEGVLLDGVKTLDGPLTDTGLVDPGALHALLASGKSDAFAAWTLGILADWCNRNLAPVAVAR